MHVSSYTSLASLATCIWRVFADAALEMMISMHLQGAVPAKVYNRIPWVTSIATSLLRMQFNGRDEG